MWFRNIFRRNPPRQAAQSVSQGVNALALPARVFAQLDRLQIRSTRFLYGSGAGRRAGTRRKPAADFREHRKYVSGDDVRFVDWKASARSEQVFLKQGELPQETAVHLLLDTSASMNWGDPPKSHGMLRLAAALGYLALSNDDRLQVIAFRPHTQSEKEAKPDGSFKGKGQFPALWNTLRQLHFNGRSDILETTRHLTRKSRGGLVLVLSDLLEQENLKEALSLLPRPTWEVSILHVLHPHELEPALSGDVQMEDVETGRIENYDIHSQVLNEYRENLAAWRSQIELTCIENKAFYTLLSTGWSLETGMIPHLHRVNILEPGL